MLVNAAAATGHGGAELIGFEYGLQRTCGIGLAVFFAQAALVAGSGAPLYPLWWFLGVLPIMSSAVLITAIACLRGRSTPDSRLLTTAVCGAGCVLTAVATADTVVTVGTAVSPIVTGLVGLLGLLDRWAVAMISGGTLILCQLGSAALTRPLRPADVAVIAFIQSAFLVAACVSGRLARSAISEQQRAAESLARAITADRAASAARADRRERERQLHDTVLSTLTALGRGSLFNSEPLRARCAADARSLRELRQRPSKPSDDPVVLDIEIRRVVAECATGHFEVRLAGEFGPAPVPAGPARALTRAAREAIVNAREHSQGASVTVRMREERNQVVVEVVDDGSGQAPANVDRLGIRRSIIERMADAGGVAEIHRDPHAGFRVVLRWPG